MTQIWQPNYSTHSGYQMLICSQYRLASQQATTQEHGIVDPEIAEHVDLLVAQLQEANMLLAAKDALISELHAALDAERAKTASICRAAAHVPVVAPEALPEAFPANALRWGV